MGGPLCSARSFLWLTANDFVFSSSALLDGPNMLLSLALSPPSLSCEATPPATAAAGLGFFATAISFLLQVRNPAPSIQRPPSTESWAGFRCGSPRSSPWTASFGPTTYADSDHLLTLKRVPSKPGWTEMGRSIAAQLSCTRVGIINFATKVTRAARLERHRHRQNLGYRVPAYYHHS